MTDTATRADANYARTRAAAARMQRTWAWDDLYREIVAGELGRAGEISERYAGTDRVNTYKGNIYKKAVSA